jgi:hypothetical protein
VLSAIEELDQHRSRHADSNEQQVLPAVPDSAMHVFQQTESTDGVTSTTTNKSNHSRAHSNTSFVSANNTSHATSKRSNNRPKMVTRNRTIEQTLSSLTEAMADLHGRKTERIQVQADMILMDDPNAGSAGTCDISLLYSFLFSRKNT